MSDKLVHNVCTDGFEMEYAQFGTGPRPLVVIPGLAIRSVMKSADALQVPFKMFTEGYTLYFFDRRKDVAPGYSVEDMARDQALALRALGLKDVALYGVSQGGMVAQHLAANYPELVWKLVLGCSTSKAEPQQLKVIGEWTRLARAHDGDGLSLDILQSIGHIYLARREPQSSAIGVVHLYRCHVAKIVEYEIDSRALSRLWSLYFKLIFGCARVIFYLLVG